MHQLYHKPDHFDIFICRVNNCEWERDPNNSSFGLYALILVDSNKIAPVWEQHWFKYYGERGYLVMGISIVERDSLGNIGLLVERGFWEARDVEVLKIDSTLGTIKSDTSYLTF
jgi:hypothetical protein